jgi:sugar-specific transcriptional regulator TrmB
MQENELKYVRDCLSEKKKLNANSEAEDSVIRSREESSSIVGYLQDFGLTEKEAMIYFSLSKMGSATAPEIADSIKFSRLQTYRAIKGLLDNGLVEMSLERPRKFTPLKIDQALNLLGQEAERKILDLEKKAPLLLKEWAAINDLQAEKTNYTFRIIQGAKNVGKFRLMLFQSAQKEIATTMKPNELLRLVLEGADDIVEKLSSNNIAVRGLSEVNKFNLDATRRFLEFSKLHHTTRQNIVPFSIIDDEEALICLSRDCSESAAENAIWTNHPEMVGILKEMFEMMWKASQDGNTRVKEIESEQISR